MKDKQKWIALSVLMTIVVALLFLCSGLQIDNRLNATVTPDDEETENTFTYVAARTSTEPRVAYENNFGGSLSESVQQVYNLDYYYLLGSTTSQNYYFFGNQTASVFVLKMSRNGLLSGVSVTNNEPCEFVASFVVYSGIYLLCKNTQTNNAILCYYAFANSSLVHLAQLDNFTPLSLTADENNIIIAGVNNQKLVLAYYALATNGIILQTTQYNASEIKLFVPYQDGVLLFLNYNYSFQILTITAQSSVTKYSNANNRLEGFCTNDYGFFLTLHNTQTVCFVFLNFSFEKLNQTLLSGTASRYETFVMQNNFYVFSPTTDNKVQALIFSSQADLVYSLNLFSLVEQLHTVTLTNSTFVVIYSDTSQVLHAIELNGLMQSQNEISVPFHAAAVVTQCEQNYDGNLLLFGTAPAAYSLIKNNFGQQDIFVIKILSN